MDGDGKDGETNVTSTRKRRQVAMTVRSWMNTALVGLAILACSAARSGAGEWGRLAGKFVYDGDPPKPREFTTRNGFVIPDESLVVGKDRGVANIFVYVRTKDVAIHPENTKRFPRSLAIDVKGQQFVPHAVAMWAGRQELYIKDMRKEPHNPSFEGLRDATFQPVVPPDGSPAIDMKMQSKSIPYSLVCNIHPWEKAVVLIRDNPYMAVSDANGTLEIADLPAGVELEFQAWHEIRGLLETPQWKLGRFRATIPAKATFDLGTIKLKPESFVRDAKL
jgi:hypothetical protein